jgi:Outer membrane protein beta-barrel domain
MEERRVMKKFMLAVFLMGLISIPLMAQDYPRAEVFGGYQFTHLGGSGTDINANGWDASLTGNFNHWLGLTADFSGAYKTVGGVSANVYTYSGGPVVSLNSGGTVNPFVHALFGGARIGASLSGLGSGSDNGFTTMVGGGADIKLNRLLAVRGQADWVFYRFSGDSESHNVRIATGLVLRF